METGTEGGIREYTALERFTATAADVSGKDSIDLMSRCLFALTAGRTEPIEHRFSSARTGIVETVRVSGSAEHGLATIHDQDLVIFAISQWVEAKRLGLEPTRRIFFTPYQFFSWIRIEPHGSAYKRLRDALHRLKTTNVETTIRSGKAGRKGRLRSFSWISEWEISEEQGRIRGVEVVLAEWLFECVQDYHVLTLDKRYFEIEGSIERWLYLYARRATGGPNALWKETLRRLHAKSASQQAYKHFAATLRKLVERNGLPGIRLAMARSVSGEAMLVMERTEEKPERQSVAPWEPKQTAQLELIERSPADELWDNILARMEKKYGEAEVRSWLGKLKAEGFDEGVLHLRAPTRFIADWISTHYSHSLNTIGQTLSCEIKLDLPEVDKANPERMA